MLLLKEWLKSIFEGGKYQEGHEKQQADKGARGM
jgi:hypothetical protein